MEDDADTNSDDDDDDDRHGQETEDKKEESFSDDERMRLTSFAHGLRGLIAELQRADEEARAVVRLISNV